MRYRESFVALAMALAAVGIVLALAGCGDLPLVDTLQRESPGELRFSPTSALVPESTPFTFTVIGGFLPYLVSSGAGYTPVDNDTFVFGGGTSPAGTRDYPIDATDHLGSTASALVTVYATEPLALSVQSITLLEGDSWRLTVSGGDSTSYTWALDGVVVQEGSGNTYDFLATSAGSYTVSVSDAVGVTRAAIVQVVPVPQPGSTLEITPTTVTVLVGGSVIFTAMGGEGPYTFSASSGSITPAPAPDLDGSPAAYAAPASKPALAPTISVTDAGSPPATASATVNVVTSPLQALELIPDSPSLSTLYDKIEFTADGGTAPYIFLTDHPSWGSIEATGPNTALYTQLANRNVLVRVTDANNTSISTMVFWR
jgi:hypothetical protein